MTTLPEFLKARLDEDEDVAIEATMFLHQGNTVRDYDNGIWSTDPGDSMTPERIDGEHMTIYAEGGHNEAHAAHIVRHDPAHVLVDVKAKRVIVREAAFEIIRRPSSPRAVQLARYTLRTMAGVYCAHPDYNNEWAL